MRHDAVRKSLRAGSAHEHRRPAEQACVEGTEARKEEAALGAGDCLLDGGGREKGEEGLESIGSTRRMKVMERIGAGKR